MIYHHYDFIKRCETRTGPGIPWNPHESSRLMDEVPAEEWEPSRGPHADGGYNLVEGSVLPVATTRAGPSVPGLREKMDHVDRPSEWM